MKKITLLAGVAALAASCSTAENYHVLTSNEYQIPGHPYKSAKNCPRKAPIGTFDARCDIPVVGFRNFSDPSMGIQSGGTGSMPIAGM